MGSSEEPVKKKRFVPVRYLRCTRCLAKIPYKTRKPRRCRFCKKRLAKFTANQTLVILMLCKKEPRMNTIQVAKALNLSKNYVWDVTSYVGLTIQVRKVFYNYPSIRNGYSRPAISWLKGIGIEV